MSFPTRALSLRQPWAHAVVHGGKRIENRTAWSDSSYRGALLIHAAKGMTVAEYTEAVAWARSQGIGQAEWTPPARKVIERGGIVGVARVIGVIKAPQGRSDPMVWIGQEPPRAITPVEARWWMGRFALVLDDVRPLPFVACVGSLSFFQVPETVRQALTKAVA